MATVDRSYPGDLSAGTGLTFRAALNADREECFGHTEQLQSSIETLVADLLGDGTLPGNAAVLYIDNPTAGRVYCPVDYMAIVGGVPVITTAIISQSYTAAVLNHVYLVLSDAGVLSLRVATGAVSEGANELWIADVTAVPAIDNTPAGKVTALIPASRLAATISAMVAGTPTFTVGAEAANVINVAVQLKDAAGANLAAKYMVHAWLSDAVAGVPPAADDTPDGGVAIGTNGVIIEAGHLQDYYWEIVSSATGAFDLNITHSLAHTYYLNLEYQGRVFSSEAIVFA